MDVASLVGLKHVGRRELESEGMAPKIITDSQKVLDVFQPGLIRGVERLAFDPSRRYFYVEHPTEGWRVYLRTACFIHQLNNPFEAAQFIVVKRTGGAADAASWEPPKGQMEGKDGGDEPLYHILRENIRREVMEEAKLTNLRSLQHTGLVLQSTEPDYPDKTFFQYHIFSGYAHSNQIVGAFKEFAWLKEHPAAFARMKREKKEKDGIAWYDPKETRLMGKWSPTIVAMYLKAFGE